MIKLDPELLSSASSSCESQSHKRAGSSDSDDYSFQCKKSVRKITVASCLILNSFF